jgi:DpnII restriction endonuclease
MQSRIEAHWLHWNMDRPEYGFMALENRWRYLTSDQVPCSPPRNRYDVDNLLCSQFGENYAPHGKLESTARLNDLDMRSFLNGIEEAKGYEASDWAKVSRSASSKAKIIGELFLRLAGGTIKTASSAGHLPFANAKLDAVQTVLAVGERFRRVQVSLRKRSHNRPALVFKDEYDDQYLLRALLVQFFDDVRDEEYSPSYAGGNSRIDYVLPDFKIAVELKHTRSSMDDSELGSQLLIDRERYNKHPDVTHLIVLVFDRENNIRNPRGIESDLQRKHSHPDLTVTVRVIDS